MVVIATGAAIVASQALISGAFSLTRRRSSSGTAPGVTDRAHLGDAGRADLHPRGELRDARLRHLALVLGFGDSSNLAAAYGIAVTGTMIITTILFHEVLTRRGTGRPGGSNLVTALFLMVDLAFFGANLVKVAHGGWFPILAAIAIFLVMTTWTRGAGDRAAGAQRVLAAARPVSCKDLRRKDVAAGAGDGRVHDVRRLGRPPSCCTISSTTRCCTIGW